MIDLQQLLQEAKKARTGREAHLYAIRIAEALRQRSERAAPEKEEASTRGDQERSNGSLAMEVVSEEDVIRDAEGRIVAERMR